MVRDVKCLDLTGWANILYAAYMQYQEKLEKGFSGKNNAETRLEMDRIAAESENFQNVLDWKGLG